MKYKLIVNGTMYARLGNVDRLKRMGLELKRVYKDAIVSIEDKGGMIVHYFF